MAPSYGVSYPVTRSNSYAQAPALLGSVNPLLSQSFDQATANYSTVKDYAFGTNPPPAGATQIADAAALAVDFQDFRNNEPKPATRNTEVQIYRPLDDPDTFVFAPDAVEITAMQPNGAPVGFGSVAIVGDVNNSETVTVSDASAFPVGQGVSLGPVFQDANMRGSRSFGILTVTVAGDTLTTTFNLSALGLSNISFTQTVDGTSANSVYAQWFVDQINANATLQDLGVRAYKSITPGAYRITWPRWNGGPNAPPFGQLANGSLTWISVSPTKTGTVLHQDRGSSLLTWVTGKVGNVLTLSHRITASNGQALYYNPFKVSERTDSYTASGVTFNVENTDNVDIDQCWTFGFNDNNYKPTASKTATSVTVATPNVGVTDGILPVLHPVWMPATSQQTSGADTLFFTTVPAGVRQGQRYMPYRNNPNSHIKVLEVNRGVSPQTVKLSEPVTVASGVRVMFYEAIHSGEMWTKAGYCPGADGRNAIALEWVADCPLASALAAWPASWLFRDATNLTGLPAPPSSAGEIDVTDPFYYSSILTTASHRPANGSPFTNIWVSPYFISNVLAGNNLGAKERTFGLVWYPNAIYFYIDKMLIVARSFTYDNSGRAQIGTNLAIGSFAAGFVGNGFFPLDASQFPMKFRLKRLRILAA